MSSQQLSSLISNYDTAKAAADAAQVALASSTLTGTELTTLSDTNDTAQAALSAAQSNLSYALSNVINYPTNNQVQFGGNVPPGGWLMASLGPLVEIFFTGWELDDYLITSTTGVILTVMIISGMGLWWSKGLCISFFYGFMIAAAFTMIPLATAAYTEGNTKKYLYYTQALIKICAMIYVIYKIFTGC